jgi:hypothetical protein
MKLNEISCNIKKEQQKILYMQITEMDFSYSVEEAPRCPELKLSMYLTQRRSKGTVVPPDVTHTTFFVF